MKKRINKIMKNKFIKENKKALTVLLVILVLALVALVFQKSYAFEGASGTSGDCNWTIDTNGKMIIEPSSGNSCTLGNVIGTIPPWSNNREDITSVEVRSGVKANTDANNLFYGLTNATTIDVRNLDTSNVTRMDFMFSGCRSLTSLDVSSFNTSNVTNMWNMFSGCRSLTSLDASNFNTINVKRMAQMFYECNSLTSLDLSNFNTSNVTDMSSMFYNCSNLKTIYASDNFSTSNANYSSSMFYNCRRLVGGNGTVYNNYKIDKEYARVDKEGTPGYFTSKSGTEESIEDAKAAAIEELDNISTDEYSEPEKSLVEEKIREAKEAINNATSEEEINNILNNLRNELENIPTDEEKEAQNLRDYKDTALDTINSLVNLSDYSGANKTAIENALNKARNDINSATNKAGVDNAVAEFMDVYNNTKTDKEIAFDNAKANALNEVNNIQVNKYSEPEKSLVEEKINDAKEAIKNATSEEEIRQIIDRLKEQLKNIPTDEEKEEQNLKDYKETELDTINDLVDLSKYSGTNKTKLEQALDKLKEAIKNAKNKAEVDKAIKEFMSVYNNTKKDTEKEKTNVTPSSTDSTKVNSNRYKNSKVFNPTTGDNIIKYFGIVSIVLIGIIILLVIYKSRKSKKE